MHVIHTQTHAGTHTHTCIRRHTLDDFLVLKAVEVELLHMLAVAVKQRLACSEGAADVCGLVLCRVYV